jgi:hypothetical protein
MSGYNGYRPLTIIMLKTQIRISFTIVTIVMIKIPKLLELGGIFLEEIKNLQCDNKIFKISKTALMLFLVILHNITHDLIILQYKISIK